MHIPHSYTRLDFPLPSVKLPAGSQFLATKFSSSFICCSPKVMNTLLHENMQYVYYSEMDHLYIQKQNKTMCLLRVFKHIKSDNADLWPSDPSDSERVTYIQVACRGPGHESDTWALAACHHPASRHLPSHSAKGNLTCLPHRLVLPFHQFFSQRIHRMVGNWDVRWIRTS